MSSWSLLKGRSTTAQVVVVEGVVVVLEVGMVEAIQWAMWQPLPLKIQDSSQP